MEGSEDNIAINDNPAECYIADTRVRLRIGFVTGHDFSRAERSGKGMGFSPCYGKTEP
jgi:hypothetical protein